MTIENFDGKLDKWLEPPEDDEAFEARLAALDDALVYCPAGRCKPYLCDHPTKGWVVECDCGWSGPFCDEPELAVAHWNERGSV